MSISDLKNEVQGFGGKFVQAVEEAGKVFNKAVEHFNDQEVNERIKTSINSGIRSLKDNMPPVISIDKMPEVKGEELETKPAEEVKPTTIETPAEVVEEKNEEIKEPQKWEQVLELLVANDNLAEISNKLTKLHYLGKVGEELVIVPSRYMKTAAGFQWFAELKPLDIDGNAVVESDKVLSTVEVVTVTGDISEMIKAYNSKVTTELQITSFINLDN